MFKFHTFFAPIAVACVACGASFTANEGNGSAAGGGNAGEASGGFTSEAGGSSVGDAGELDAGGSSAAGQRSTAGAGGSVVGAGGTIGAAGWGSGRGGWGNGGWRSGAGGGATLGDCATLQQEYEAAVQKARVCDKGSMDQCSPSSVAQPVSGCGCAVLINAKSEAATAAKKAYQAYQDAKCDHGGAVCNAICAPPLSASCEQQAMTSGNTFMCASGVAIQN